MQNTENKKQDRNGHWHGCPVTYHFTPSNKLSMQDASPYPRRTLLAQFNWRTLRRGLPDNTSFLLTKLRRCNHNTAVNTLLCSVYFYSKPDYVKNNCTREKELNAFKGFQIQMREHSRTVYSVNIFLYFLCCCFMLWSIFLKHSPSCKIKMEDWL